MQILQVHIFIENMPKYEQKFGVKIFSENFIKNLKENNIFVDIVSCTSGINLWFLQFNILKFHTEKKIVNEDIENLRSKYPLARFETINGKYVLTIEEEPVEKRIIDCFEKTLKSHQWSSAINFGGYTCVRPVRKISIKLDKKFLSGQYSSIVYSSFDDSEKSFDEKKTKIYKLLEEYFVDITLLNERIIEENSASTFDPISIMIEFEKKYLEMPFDLIEKIVEELLGFTIPFSNKCILILEKNLKVPKENFEKVINNKMHDIYVLFKRDINSQDLFEKSQKIFLGENLGTVKDKTERMKNIAMLMNLKNLDHLIDLYYYDISSHIVQGYPSLKGVIVQKISPEGKIIRNAHKSSGDFISLTLKALEYIDNVICLPMFSSTKDPFAIKKQVDFLIDFFATNSLYFDFKEKNHVFMKRAKSKLKDHRKFFYSDSLQDQISILNIKPLQLSPVKLSRIINIVKGSEKTRNIEVRDKIEGLTRDNLSEKIDQIILYIENNQINPYKERIEMIENFIDQIQSILDINSLLQEGASEI